MTTGKIVGIGCNKTGTTSLGQCMRYLGFKHKAFDRSGFEFWRNGQMEELLARVAEFDTFEDWPWPLVYKEIDERFPGSKFILTTRRSPDAWFKSLCKHSHRTGPTVYREVIYGHAMPEGHRDEHVAWYERHNAEVRSYFKDRPGDLLEVCWEHGDGWRELASFLEIDEPRIPFPHANKAPK